MADLPASIAPALAGAAAAASATLLALALLARPARRRGWTDPAPGGALPRKLQGRPVPPVGGVAVALGALAGLAATGARAPAGAVLGSGLPLAGGAAVALLVGLLDDLRPRGLSPRAKLAGQLAAGLALAALLALERGGLPLGLWLVLPLAAAVAQNLVNTFDHADGCAGSAALLALALPLPAAAGAVGGFLAANLGGGETGARARWLPKAYLGDAGSHLLGVLVLASPLAWPALVLPALDLARVLLERARDGQPAWQGDRRHLGQLLAAAGVGRVAVAAVVTLVALPAVVGGTAALVLGPAWPAVVGVAATAAAYGLALARATRRPRVPAAQPT